MVLFKAVQGRSSSPCHHNRSEICASHPLTDYRYLLFSARALQSNEAALWLYARVRAPPTSAAEGCEVREIWKGSWTSTGSRLRWSLVSAAASRRLPSNVCVSTILS